LKKDNEYLLIEGREIVSLRIAIDISMLEYEYRIFSSQDKP